MWFVAGAAIAGICAAVAAAYGRRFSSSEDPALRACLRVSSVLLTAFCNSLTIYIFKRILAILGYVLYYQIHYGFCCMPSFVFNSLWLHFRIMFFPAWTLCQCPTSLLQT